jgi:hypothetical protein
MVSNIIILAKSFIVVLKLLNFKFIEQENNWITARQHGLLIENVK